MNYDIFPTKILKDIYFKICQNVKDNNKIFEITKLLSKYNHLLINGSKEILHLEAFVINIIDLLH